MTQCPRCSAINRPVARFCGRCGMPLVPTMPLAVGATMRSRYRVLNLLGRGGMGAVYLVEDLNVFGKHWALKELLDTLLPPAERPQAVRQFQAEAQMLVRLSHPNLPYIADYFSEGGRQYLVMEYVDGETLEAILGKTSGFLAEAQVLEWALQLCDALAYLHRQNPPVIFRDLKPDNVMLTRTGSIKLIDFGIARFFKPGQTSDTRNLGTPGFAAPEQYGKGQTDARSDIYTLGVTLHRLLTRHDPASQPFKFPPCRSLNSSISPQLDAVIGKALQQDPSQRYQTAAEMKQALLQLMPSRIGPTPPTPGVAAPASRVAGPEPVPWVQTSPMNALEAYCGACRRETAWVEDYDGSCTCIECGRSWPTGSVEEVVYALCKKCGRQTTWALSDESCTCLGCGQSWEISNITGVLEAYCNQCKTKTPWVIGDVDYETHRICLWCGQQR